MQGWVLGQSPRRRGSEWYWSEGKAFPLCTFWLFFYNKVMFTIIFGIACIVFTIFACLPAGLNWGENIMFVLKGIAPILAALVGLLAILIGIADVRDRNEAKREEREAMKNEE